MHDPALGRFTGVDPIADSYPHVSPFNYAENSPIANIDLHGLQAVGFMQSFYSSRERIRKEHGEAGAREFDRGFRKGGKVTAEIGAGFTPAGVALDFRDAGIAIRDGDAVGLGLAGVGFIPGIGDAFKAVGKGIREFFGGAKKSLGDLDGLDILSDAQAATIKGGSLFRKGKVDDFEFASGHGSEVIENSDTYIKKIRDLSDEGLIKTLEPDHPSWGTITIKRGVILRGNNRLYELKKRGLDVEFEYRQLVDDNREYFYDYD